MGPPVLPASHGLLGVGLEGQWLFLVPLKGGR